MITAHPLSRWVRLVLHFVATNWKDTVRDSNNKPLVLIQSRMSSWRGSSCAGEFSIYSRYRPLHMNASLKLHGYQSPDQGKVLRMQHQRRSWCRKHARGRGVAYGTSGRMYADPPRLKVRSTSRWRALCPKGKPPGYRNRPCRSSVACTFLFIFIFLHSWRSR